MSAGAAPSSRLTLGRIPLQACMFVDRIPFLVVCQLMVRVPCWPPSISCPRGPAWRLPLFLATGVSHCTDDNVLHQSQKLKESTESASKIEVTVLCSTTMEVTFHRLCHVLLLRSRSQTLPAFRGITQGHECQRQEQSGGHLECVCHPSPTEEQVIRDH